MSEKSPCNKTMPDHFLGLTGAELFNEMLLAHNVDMLFGYPGAAVIPILDVLYDSSVNFILTRHEQGAIHMAEGYAKATGRPGVVMATSGPGATNLVTGLANAYMDSTPLVAFSGQVKSHLLGNDAFQEADMTGITRPITKHNCLVTRVEDLPRMINEAFHIATTGRPGPVLVDIAVDATTGQLDKPCDYAAQLPGYKPQEQPNAKQIQAAAQTINESKRPILYVGGGVIHSDASEELRALISKAQLPATTSLMGLGSVDETTESLSLQMLGMHGSAAANWAVQECDCLIAVGARFSDRVTARLDTFAPHARIIHLDIDPTSISKNVPASIPVVGDAKQTLAALLPHVQKVDRGQWLEKLAEWKREYAFRYPASNGRIRPQQLIETLAEMTNHEAIIATGVGQHQMFAAQFYGWKRPRQLITSGGLGTMGFGVPAAIGAQFACPDQTVIDIDGDGSFSMTMVELITAVQHNLPVKFVVLDNGYLGMVRQWQELFYNERYSGVHNPQPDFVKIVEGFGATGIRIDHPSQMQDGVRQLLNTEGPAVLVAQTEQTENVYPMVPAGKSLHEMELGHIAP